MRTIKSIEIENFKSLVDFQIELSKFNCLIGLNGSGKSTVLQCIDFLSQLVQGDIKKWLDERKWKHTELKSKLSKKRNVEFCIRFVNESGEPAGRWEGSYNPKENICTQERIDMLDFVLTVESNFVIIRDVRNDVTSDERGDKKIEIAWEYQGSILSGMKEDVLPPSILECKQLCEDIKSLDLLSPEYLRQQTRESTGKLGLGGQRLSAFLHELPTQKLLDLTRELRNVYPQLQSIYPKPLRSGLKQIEISESYEGAQTTLMPTMTTEARHVNDGMLRLIAIWAELQSEHGFLLFDEIENGINPELIQFVMNALIESPKQIMVTTHSPMILNYVEDELAKKGVIYLYKTRAGATKSIPFFSIPSLEKKVDFMGPGEVFVDTNLKALSDEIESITQG